MASPSKPSDFAGLVLTSSATLCDRFKAVLLSLPSKLYDLANYMLDADGNPSKTFAKDLLANTGVWSAGDVKATFSSSTPDGWLECEGQAVSRTTYSILFAAIGENHGEGDGTNTFNIPDLRARSVVGKNDGELKDSDFSSFPVHAAVGSEETEITEQNFPAHTHEVFTYARQEEAEAAGGSVLNAADFKTYNDKLYAKGNYSIEHEHQGHHGGSPSTNALTIGLDGYGVTSAYGTGDASGTALSLIQPCLVARFLVYSGHYTSA
jgi:microcystin-dependent protein